MKKVIIAGGGISGLVCAHVFSGYGIEPMILEPSTIGGEFLAGGLKYIHRTELAEEMFDCLDVPWSSFTIKGGILLRGDVVPYPKGLAELERADAIRIQNDHYKKTRRMEPGEFGTQAMNDPAGSKPRRALRCYFPELINSLARGRNIVKSALLSAAEGVAIVGKGNRIEYDYLVLTIPLWVIKRTVDFYVPDGVAMKLNIAMISPKKDPFASWDYIYTPYTPADCIHRISPDGDDYAVEANGQLDESNFHSDLNFLFKDGWFVNKVRSGLKGHLLPLDSQPEVPDNVCLLGRFAKWDPRMTVDVTLEKSIELAERWFG